MFQSNLLLRTAPIGALAAALAMSQLAAPTTLAANPASISGDWAGSGTMKLQSGSKERVRCRVKYGRIAGQDFSLNARCATSGTSIDQTGKLTRVSKGRYIGSVHNEQFNVSAKITIKVSGGHQEVSISSKEGTANIRLKRR